MLLILEIILTVSAAYFAACFSFLLDYCFWDGSIFENYLPWLAKKILHKKDRAKFNLIMSMGESARNENFIQSSQNYFFYKILGGCIICTNVWLCMLFSLPLVWFGVFSWYMVLPFIVCASRFLRKMIA